ncbi:sensor histidine kinase [Spirosoma pulveris]
MNEPMAIPLLARIVPSRYATRFASLLVLCVLVYNDGFSVDLINRYGLMGQWAMIGQFALQAGIYFSWGYWLFPRYLYRFKPLPLLTGILLTYTLSYIANYLIFSWLHRVAGFPATEYNELKSLSWQNVPLLWELMNQRGPLGLYTHPGLFGWNFLLSFAYPSLLLAAKAFYDNMASQVNNARLKEQNVQLELDYLKSQINPHFLFNVLNSVYALTEEDCPRAAQLVHQLSGMLQYTLYETTEPKVPLHKELQFIRDYVALEKNRTGKRVDLQVDLPEFIPETLQIVPFLLIPFVENAFKHGVQRTARKSWVQLQVSVTGNDLHLLVSNSKPAAPEPTTGGLGLANARKRLALLYPTHRLALHDETTQYSVSLTVDLTA